MLNDVNVLYRYCEHKTIETTEGFETVYKLDDIGKLADVGQQRAIEFCEFYQIPYYI